MTSVPKEQLEAIIRTTRDNVESIANALRYQIMNNSDQVVHELKKRYGEEVAADFQQLFEPLVSGPVKRAIGRLRGVQRTLDHAGDLTNSSLRKG